MMTAHFWQGIDGYFTFPEFYTWLATRAWDWKIVEVGVHCGQSAAYLAVEMLNFGYATPRLDLVDVFHVGLEKVRQNLAPVASMIGAYHQGLSWEMAKRYADHSVDAVFIDASHDYVDVARDIDAWLPKVRAGGVIAGHDFAAEFPGVMQAVTERFDRWELWRGQKGMSDVTKQPTYYPVWCVKL